MEAMVRLLFLVGRDELEEVFSWTGGRIYRKFIVQEMRNNSSTAKFRRGYQPKMMKRKVYDGYQRVDAEEFELSF